MKKNLDLRDYAHKRGVYLWQLADFFGFSEMTLYRHLRAELSPADKTTMLEAVDMIADSREGEN